MNKYRKQEARNTRISAAELAADRPHPRHIANDDETKFRNKKSKPSYLASFTKGLPHDEKTGLVKDPEHFQQFVKAIDSGDPQDFKNTPLGPDASLKKPRASCLSIEWKSKIAKNAKLRAWESQSAGNNFDLEGPDAQAVTMPPAPEIGSDELIAEMAELYAQAYLRDTPFTDISAPNTKVKKVIDMLNKLPWFQKIDCCKLDLAVARRKRNELNSNSLFRGTTFGDNIGPYISQFLLAGTTGINSNDKQRASNEGMISYGAISIDQRVRIADEKKNYMTKWSEWLDVQNGANLGGKETYQKSPKKRFIYTPRDLATYVHYDALYQAYLNACLLLLWYKIPFDPGIPFQQDDCIDHQQGFALFGGPHILTLVTEVATRALKAVRFQKFNIHRRLRPEALAARLEKADMLTPEALAARHKKVTKSNKKETELNKMSRLLGPFAALNPYGNLLLPMAYPEGSPMHPAYGAGHATVAGACVTILKAFFDHKHSLNFTNQSNGAFEADPTSKDKKLRVIKDINLTVEGELNKLASNISIGRNWAGVHYFSDYIESIRMGEQIAIGILEEQKLTYQENFSMTVPLFDGGSIRI